MLRRLAKRPPRIWFITSSFSQSGLDRGTPSWAKSSVVCSDDGLSTITTRSGMRRPEGGGGSAPPVPFQLPNECSARRRASASVRSPASMSAAFAGTKALE